MKIKKVLTELLPTAPDALARTASAFKDGADKYVAELYSYDGTTTKTLMGRYTSVAELCKHIGESDAEQIFERVKLLKSTNEDILVFRGSTDFVEKGFQVLCAVECAEGVNWGGNIYTARTGYCYKLLGDTMGIGPNTYQMCKGQQTEGNKCEVLADNTKNLKKKGIGKK